jgi:hypothetical protein
MRLTLLPGRFSVCRLEPQAKLPERFWSSTRTEEELSVITAEGEEPRGAKVEPGWRVLKLEGPIPFTMTGVLHALLEPLAKAMIGIFAVSTFDTDYVFVKAADCAAAVACLRAADHEVSER